MWALRRASINLRSRCLSSGTTRISSVESEIASFCSENHNAEFPQSQLKTRFHNTSSSSIPSLQAQTFSSLAGAKSSGDLLKDDLSQLKTRHYTVHEAASDDASISDSELSEGVGVADDAQNELAMLDNVSDVCEKESSTTEAPSGLIKAVLSTSSKRVNMTLDRWIDVGNEVTQTEVSRVLLLLYRRRMFNKALQVYRWLDSRLHLEFTEIDYARCIDLIAKVRGIYEAEKYIQQVPRSSRSEIFYSSLLKNYVAATNVSKAEDLFFTMKNFFPLTCISCNQMLCLYKMTNRKKIADVLSFMKRENIKWSNVTYQIVIDAKGQAKDISGMKQVLETMKSDGVEPSLRNRASLAQYYAACGRTAKAEAELKDMEGGDLVKNRYACRFLLPVYAKLGRGDEVERIWQECESGPNPAECIAAMKAWGALARIEDAEAAFEKLLEILKNPISKHYVILLDIYANHRMLAKGEDLFRRMTEKGVDAPVSAWDALVKLYAGGREVDKADAILDKLIQRRRGRPRAASFLCVLDGYARRGDVINTEKVFCKMRNVGYGVEARPYHSLVLAYINARVPTVAFKERLRRDNVIPDEKLARLLARLAELTK